MSALKEFANFITLNLANLATTYARLLAERGAGYEALPANSRVAAGRRLLKAAIEACELESSTPLDRLFCHFPPESKEQASVSPRWSGDFNPPNPLLELECLGQTLTPVVTNLEAGKFLWQILAEVRSTILRAGTLAAFASEPPSLPQAGPSEQPLLESEPLYQALVDALPQNVYRVDREGRIVFGNQAYLSSLGLTLDECLGKTAYDLFPQELADKYTADDKRVIETGEVFNTVESHQVPATGETKYVQVLKTPIRDNTGEIVGLQAVFWDVTDRKQAQVALAHERDLLQALLDNSPDYIFFKDKQSRIINTGKAHAALLGFADPKEAVGKTDFDLFPPQNAQRYFDEEQRIIQSGQPIIDRVGQTPDSEGNVLWLSETKMPLYDEAGQVIGLFGISRNITERKQAEEILAKRAAQLQAVTEIGTAAAAILERDQLLQEVTNLTKARFGLYHAHIYLLDEFGDTLNLIAGAGEVGRQLVSQGWSIPINHEQSMVAKVARTGAGLTINDVQQNPHYLPNPLLPDTRSEMAVPLVVGGLVLGVLDVQSDQVNRFTDVDVQINTALASQVAVALQNAEQYEYAQQTSYLLSKRVQELNCLNEIGREMEETVPVSELLPWVAERIPRAMQYPELCKTAIEFDGEVYGVAEAIDLPAQMTHGIYIRGEVLGRVYIAYTEKHDFLDEESSMLGAIASRLSGYIENRRLLQQTEAALAEAETLAQEQAVLYELGQALTARLNVEQVLEEVYQQTSRLVDTTNFYIGLYDPAKDEVSFPLQVSESELDRTITVIEASQGLAGYIVRNRTSLLFEDNVRERQEALGIRMVGEEALSWLGVPLMIGDEVLGVLAVQSHTTPRLYNDHDRELLTAIANQVAIALQTARQFEETQSALAEVRQSQELLQTIMNATPDWIFIKDQEHRFRLVNQAYADSLNLSPDDIIGKTDLELGFPEDIVKGNPEKGIRGFWPDDREVMETGERKLVEVEPAVIDGKPIFLRTVKVPLRDDAGQVWGVLGFVSDISVREQLLAEVERRARREQTIREITDKMRAATSLDQLLKTATEELGERLSAGHAVVELGLAAAMKSGRQPNGAVDKPDRANGQEH